MKLLGIAGAVVAVFSAGSEATYPHKSGTCGTQQDQTSITQRWRRSYSFRNPNGGVNSNSFRSSYNIYGPYERRLYGKYPWDPTRPNYYNLNAGGNTYSFSNPNDSLIPTPFDHPLIWMTKILKVDLDQHIH